MNTYVNVVLLRLPLSVEQLAKSDQHLEEELIFCAQPNPLSQWGTYLPWINLLLHTSVWFTYDRPDVCLDIGDLLYGPQLLLRERDRVTCMVGFVRQGRTIGFGVQPSLEIFRMLFIFSSTFLPVGCQCRCRHWAVSCSRRHNWCAGPAAHRYISLSLGFGNIDDRHRHPNVNIREIID